MTHKTKRGKYHQWLTDDGQMQIQDWARCGLSDAQLAHNMGVHVSTLYVWFDKYPEIHDAVKKGRAPVTFEVENALLKNALGFEYEETETYIELSEDGSKATRIKKVKRYQRPDTTAQIFWLKNRRNDRWSNIEASTQRKQSAEMLKMSVETELAEQRLKEMSADKVPIMIELVELERPDEKGQE